MAKIQIRGDGNPGTILATRDIPDAVVARAVAVYGGATNQETAANVLRAIWKDFLRPALGNNAAIKARNDAMVNVQAAVDAAAALFESEVPEGAP